MTIAIRHSNRQGWAIVFTGKWWRAWRNHGPFVCYKFKRKKDAVRFIYALGKDLDLKEYLYS